MMTSRNVCFIKLPRDSRDKPALGKSDCKEFQKKPHSGDSIIKTLSAHKGLFEINKKNMNNPVEALAKTVSIKNRKHDAQ